MEREEGKGREEGNGRREEGKKGGRGEGGRGQIPTILKLAMRPA